MHAMVMKFFFHMQLFKNDKYFFVYFDKDKSKMSR